MISVRIGGPYFITSLAVVFIMWPKGNGILKDYYYMAYNQVGPKDSQTPGIYLTIYQIEPG